MTYKMSNFIILTSQRTGSTLFWRYLDQHPSIGVFGELLLKTSRKDESYKAFKNLTLNSKIRHLFDKKNSVDQFLNKVFSSDKPVQSIGFKLMYDQINKPIDKWINNNEIKIIHLVRRNTLKVILSLKTAKKRKLYHSTGKEKIEKVNIKLKPKKTLKEIETIQKNIKKYRELYLKKDYIEIFYEDFVEDMNKQAQEIFSFLGLNPFKCSTIPLKKINPDSIQAIVDNYDEIETFFKKTKYSEFLE